VAANARLAMTVMIIAKNHFWCPSARHLDLKRDWLQFAKKFLDISEGLHYNYHSS
jgi:hypothetical protein